MATNEVPRGPVGAFLTGNVQRLRKKRGWSLAELSQQMKEAGRPMLPSGLHRVEQGNRRVDVDDLIALAVAFEVSPITLLLPWQEDGQIRLTEAVVVDALTAWDWVRGQRPLNSEDDGTGVGDLNAIVDFRTGSVPPAAWREDETTRTLTQVQQQVGKPGQLVTLQAQVDQLTQTLLDATEKFTQVRGEVIRTVQDAVKLRDIATVEVIDKRGTISQALPPSPEHVEPTEAWSDEGRDDGEHQEAP